MSRQVLADSPEPMVARYVFAAGAEGALQAQPQVQPWRTDRQLHPPARRFSLKGPIMLTVETRHAVHADHAKGLGTEELRRHFLARAMCAGGEIRLVHTRYDRMVIGGAVTESCQLVPGYTELLDGSVWNAMPAHLHDRRMEACLYRGMSPEARVLHLRGEPQETRHLVVADEEAVVRPSWSVHAGAGIGAFPFIRAMAGDNVDYTDMDIVPPGELR